MKIDRIVIQYKDGSVLKGSTEDFSPEKSFFHLIRSNGGVMKVTLEDLKAAFLVKSLLGNKDYTYTYKDSLPWGGKRIRVTFLDGEVMTGYVPFFLNRPKWFLMTPADLKGNNKDVLIVTSAVSDILYL